MRSLFPSQTRSLPRRLRANSAGRMSLEHLEGRTLMAAACSDSNFGSNGVVRTDFIGSRSDIANDLVVRQSDGKILAVGYTSASTTDVALVRYNADGSPDASFGPHGDGRVIDAGLGSAQSVALDTNGNVVVAGSSWIVRYTARGDRDASFGGGGLVNVGNVGNIQGLAIDGSNRVVVAGYLYGAVSSSSLYDFAAVRYNANGTLDLNFDSVDFGDSYDFPQAIAIDSLDRVIVAGYTQSPIDGQLTDFAVVRYNASGGGLDSSFGSGGKTTIDFNGDYDAAGSVAIDASDNIIVGGSARFSGNNGVAIVRLNAANGGLDTAFAASGRLVDTQIYADYSSFDLAVDAAGKIVAGTQSTLLRYTTAGNRDLGFGIHGSVSVGSSLDQISGVAVQADGKILVGGYAYNGAATGQDFAVARFSATGDPDPGFGASLGFLTTDFVGSRTDLASDLVVRQSDGKIVVAGYTYAGTTDFALIRYNADGTPDTSFGPRGDGKVTDAGLGSARSLALDSNGNVLVAGSSWIVRYTASGDRDGSFGGGGLVNVGSVGNIQGLAIDGSNRVVVAGYRYNAVSGSSLYDFTAARYNVNGTLDVNFDSVDFGGSYDLPQAIAIDGAGRVIVAGYTQNSSNGQLTDFGVVRYNASGGGLDTTFGSSGKTTIDFNGDFDAVGSVAIDAGNNIIVGGSARVSGGDRVALARLNAANGSLDNSFGSSGRIVDTQFSSSYSTFDLALDAAGRIVIGTLSNLLRYTTAGIRDLQISTSSSVSQISGVALQADGNILIGGSFNSGGATGTDFAVARDSAAGLLDGGFGSGGVVRTDFVGSESDFARDLVVHQSDGKILVAGYTSGNTTDFALIRYNADGTPDTTFGTSGDGKVIDPGLGDAQSLALDSSGNVVLAGSSWIVRYTASGSRDASFGSGGLVNVVGVSAIQGVAIDGSNRVVVAGYRYNAVSSSSFYDFTTVRYNANGTLDVNFAPVDFGGTYDFPRAVAIDSVGRVIVAGYSQNPSNGLLTDFGVVRYNASGGGLDTTFGSGGKKTIDFNGEYDAAGSMAIDASDNIIVGGSARVNGNDQVALVRLSAANGSVDTSFGVAGKIVDTQASASFSSFDLALDATGKVVVGTQSNLFRYGTSGGRDLQVSTGNFVSQISGVAIQADGRILIGGYRYGSGNTGTDFAVARFSATGTPDASFGPRGVVRTDFLGSRSDFASDLVVRQSDGKILVAGYTSASTTDFALIRYNVDGTPDTSFGPSGDGKVTDAGLGTARRLALDSNGNVVVAGGSSVVRYTAGGIRDASFGGDGLLNVGSSISDIRGLAIDANNRVVLAGYRYNAVSSSSLYDFAVARYNVNGTLDVNFDSVDFGGSYDIPEAIAIDSVGRVIVAGYTQNSGNGQLTDFGVVRYSASGGGLDTTFGSGGKTTVDFDGDFDAAGSLVIDASNNIIVGGMALVSGLYRVALLRLNAGNGSLDTSFGVSGRVADVQVPAYYTFFDLALDPAGNIVVGSQSTLDRYSSAGSRDPSFGNQGSIYTGGSVDQISGVAVQADGKILVAGYYYSSDATGYDFAVARYLGSNRPPTAVDDLITTNEDSAVAISVRSNDSDPDGDSLSISSVNTGGTLGLVTINANGMITYNPNGAFESLAAGQTTSDTFVYTISDGYGGLASATVTITVTGVNDAPVLSGAINLTSITEDQTSNGGDLVSELISGEVTDVDAGAMQGIAIVTTASGNGTWQYSVDNRATWNIVGTTSNTAALLLRPEDAVRFVPDGNNGTTASVRFRAWDQTFGTAGNKINASTIGGSTAISLATATSSIAVVSVNDGPTVATDNVSVTVNEGQTVANSGTYSDVDLGDSITITASIGTVTKTGTNGGTWSWSYTPTDGPAESQLVTITADDGNAGLSTTAFALTVNNVVPTATLNVLSSIVYGDSLNVGLASPFDASSADSAAGLHYAFAYSTTDSSPLTDETYGSSTATASASFSSVHVGTYYVFARIIDKDGGFTAYSQQVTITPAPLAITAAAQTKVYGQADPALTYGVSGLQFTDGESTVLNGALARAVGEHVASYAISQGTLVTNSDYAISFTGSSLTITPATLAITAAAQTKVYGQADPAWTYVVSGLQFTDGETTVLNGALARAAGEHVASYAIGQGTLAANSDYTISFTGSSLTITPAALTAGVVGDPTKVYDGNTDAALTPLNFSLTGLVGSDSMVVTQSSGNYNSQDVATANTVTAALSAGNFTMGSGTIAGDYTLPTTASGAGHVSKAGATIVVTPYYLTYNGVAHTATGTASGVLGESLGGLILSGTTHTGAGTTTDTWIFNDVTGNYDSTSGTVSDNIGKANATIWVTPYGVTYDANTHTATGTVIGVDAGAAALGGALLSCWHHPHELSRLPERHVELFWRH